MRHPHQIAALQKGLEAIEAKQQLLITAPTGSGKSFIAADLLTALPDALLTVPNHDIACGVYNKLTNTTDEPDQSTLESARIWTVKRLYNEALAGRVPIPKYLIDDECHHSTDATHSLIWEACGRCPSIGLSATPFRGTPKETAKLRERYPNIYRALTLTDACAQGIISRPSFETWGLLNDDEISVHAGEFVVSSVDGAVTKILPDVVERSQIFYDGSRWKRPLMFRVSSVATADLLTQALNDAGLPSLAITGGTKNRQELFAKVVYARTHALVQIKVVGEGVDLPMRVLIDLAPTMSPLYWQQAVGRITRPTKLLCNACGGSFVGKAYDRSYTGDPASTCPTCFACDHRFEEPPVYICTNHNLARHCYLWSGLIPVNQVKQAQEAFGPAYKPSRRTLARAIGVEGFGRFTVSLVPLRDGTAASLYSLQTRDGLSQFAVILHPMMPEPFYFQRTNALTGETGTTPDGWTFSKKQYGRWKRIESIPDCDGYVSVKPSAITARMAAWYKRSAARVGLHPDHEPDAREFTALPILTDCNLRFGG